MNVLVVDGANVVGCVPDGWWRDRAGAAERLRAGLVAAATHAGGEGVDAFGGAARVVLVLEGAARTGAAPGTDGVVTTVHAPAEGDDEIVARCESLAAAGDHVVIATADRGLLDRLAHLHPDVLGPRTLRARLTGATDAPTSAPHHPEGATARATGR